MPFGLLFSKMVKSFSVRLLTKRPLESWTVIARVMALTTYSWAAWSLTCS